MASCTDLFNSMTTFISQAPSGEAAYFYATLTTQTNLGAVSYGYGQSSSVEPGQAFFFYLMGLTFSPGSFQGVSDEWNLEVTSKGLVQVTGSKRGDSLSFTGDCSLAQNFWVGAFTTVEQPIVREAPKGPPPIALLKNSIAVLSVKMSYGAPIIP